MSARCEGCLDVLREMIARKQRDILSLEASVRDRQVAVQHAKNNARAERLGSIIDLADLHRKTPLELEALVADLFRVHGYQVKTTKASGDRGVDVVATRDSHRIAVQCKKYAPQHGVGIEEVQRMLGVMMQDRANKCAIVTTSYFTREAQIAAKSLGVKLIDGRCLLQILGDQQPLADLFD